MDNTKMHGDLKNRTLLWLVIVLFFLSVLFTAYKVFVIGDYMIEVNVPCDPTSEKCFVTTCEDGDTECEVSYYKLMLKRESVLKVECGETLDSCDPVPCAIGDKDCEIRYCDAENPDHVCAELPTIEED